MDRWYTWVENQIYGPYVPEQLMEFLQAETMICREGSEEWKPAKDFPEMSLILVGIPVEPPPNVGWMHRKAGSDQVRGPFFKTKISEMIQSGEISLDDEVKHTDWDDWEVVRKTKLVTHKKLLEIPQSIPNPEGFHKVVLEAPDEELMREYKENNKLYARRERKMLKEELIRRGLIKKTFGLF